MTLPPPRPRSRSRADDPAQCRRHRHSDAAGSCRAREPRPARSLCRSSIRSGAFRLRRAAAAKGVPRISLPGVTAPFPVTPCRPPAPDDRLDATRLALRFKALGAALDDLPDRPVASLAGKSDAGTGRTRRVWPLRPGCPPGQRPAAGARTRCTRSCTISTALPSTCWSIPTRRDRPPPLHGRLLAKRRSAPRAFDASLSLCSAAPFCPTAQPGRASGPTRRPLFRLNSTHEPARQHHAKPR